MRYIFLQSFSVDKKEESVQGEVEVTKDWEVFRDHFPGYPILPGALILEIMAQHTVALMLELKQDKKAVIPTLIQVDRAKFIEPVIPDCTLKVECKKSAMVYPNFKFECEAFVNERKVAAVRITMAFKEMAGAPGLDFMGFFLKGAMG